MRVRRKPTRDTWRDELIMRACARNRCRRALTRKNVRIRRKERRTIVCRARRHLKEVMDVEKDPTLYNSAAYVDYGCLDMTDRDPPSISKNTV